jgi:hypothetical protein
MPPRAPSGQAPSIKSQAANDPEALALFREHTTGEKHVHRNDDTDNVSIKHGNSKAYTLERLKRDRPDLFEKVVAKEMSANAAAKAAGWRKEKSALDTLRKAWAKATPNKPPNNKTPTRKFFPKCEPGHEVRCTTILLSPPTRGKFALDLVSEH